MTTETASPWDNIGTVCSELMDQLDHQSRARNIMLFNSSEFSSLPSVLVN